MQRFTFPRPGGVSPLVGRRDLRIDFLRGFAVLAMVVDHVGGTSPLYALTGGNRFFVSAAEGFVFISGLLVGVVYGGELRRAGFRAAARKTLLRAFTLYSLSVWLTLGFATFSTLLGLPWAPAPQQVGIGQFVLQVVTFQRAYYLVDVMQLYALLLLATPLALWLLGRGKWAWLLGASLAVWAGYQVSAGRLELPWPIADNAVFHFSAWQVVFFSAMALGYEREALGRLARRPGGLLALPIRGGWLGPLAVVLAAMIWLHETDASVLARLGVVADPAGALDTWFNKGALPPLRLAAAVVVFAFAWNLASRGWWLIQPALGWFLLPLGTQALYAYAYHLFVAGALRAMTPWIAAHALAEPGPDESSGMHLGLTPATSMAIQIVAVVTVWLLVRWDLPRRLVGWLGAPPIRSERRASPRGVLNRRPLDRAFAWRPASSSAAILGLSVVGFATLALPWPDLTPSLPPETPYAAAELQAGQRPRVVVTVTAKRRLADLGPKPGEELRARALGTPVPPGPSVTPVPAATQAAAGHSILEDRTFYSPALGRVMPYGIYLPPGYTQDPTRRYPVVYLLHGGPGDYSEWPQLGVGDAEDELVARGEAQPLIMVFPEGEESYFFNHPDGPAWGDSIALDLVRHVDETERTIADRASRAIAGMSMGGHGALQLAFNYPDVFGVVAAHAPALRSYETGRAFFGTAEDYARFDPLQLARTVDRPPLAIRLDAGEEDTWIDQVKELHKIFHQRHWRHRYRIYTGGHVIQYWIDHMQDFVKFYSESLRSMAATAAAETRLGEVAP